ncbi:MAG: LacI family DNA-binding transcriptional regulator [Anaerolineae bacterium]|nr:LacI family transcriptional regulator [Anaerolineae bacterium]MDW8100510.1 LacI family DNA-binding transcriptional regulator [Anaerolineae bacterium]
MPRDRRASLKDVAMLANTSVATASRVLNGKGYASLAARQRVLEAAKLLGYHPNLRARGLRQRSSCGIGLIIPNLLNAYYTALADAISQLLAGSGYHLLLSSTRDDPLLEQAIVYDMIGQDVAGLIWVPSSRDRELVDYLLRQRIPAVSIVRRVPGDVLDTVVFADYDGSYAATQHLIRLGHRAIGYIGGDVRYSSNYARWQGYLAALSDASLSVDEQRVKLGVALSAWGETAASELLQLPSPPTAIFVASNAIMPGVIKLLRRQGVAIPKEMSLICFDDVDWFSFSVPPITAVQISHARLAETALELLLKRIEDPQRPLSYVEIDFELVLRSSTGPPCYGPESESENALAGWMID